jgi:hypothetical protein
MSLETLTRSLVKFRDERDWAQFHTLRNLIVSLNLLQCPPSSSCTATKSALS